MKKNICVILAVCFSYLSVFSQTTERFYIKGGMNAMEEFKKVIYLNPQFQNGMVELKNGQKFTRSLNYNFILGTVEFINERNDTLAIADETAVSSVIIGNDVFIFTPACLRTISKGKVKLYAYEKMKIGDVQKVGAFGIPNSGSAIATFNRIDTYTNPYNIDVNETIIITKATYFLVETDKHEFVPITKKTVLRTAPGKESEIKEYIKEHNVNFNKKAEVQELINYISGL